MQGQQCTKSWTTQIWLYTIQHSLQFVQGPGQSIFFNLASLERVLSTLDTHRMDRIWERYASDGKRNYLLWEYTDDIRWHTICIYMHLASRRSWRRHRRNWRWLRGVHRAVMGSVVVTKVVIGPIGLIDSPGLRGTWTVQVSTCAIYNTLHTLHGASHKFYGCSGGKTKCLSATFGCPVLSLRLSLRFTAAVSSQLLIRPGQATTRKGWGALTLFSSFLFPSCQLPRRLLLTLSGAKWSLIGKQVS